MLLLLAVIGVGAATVLLQALGQNTQELKRQLRSQQMVHEAREALIGYAATHGRLPRPARSPLDGREREQPCLSNADCTGLIPWVTLGIRGSDDWAKRLRYSVTPAFSVRPLHSATAVADKTILSRDRNGQLYYTFGNAACSLQTQCAAAVVFSNGRRNLGVSVDGVLQANSDTGNRDEVVNDRAVNDFISRPYNADASQPGGEFDDLVSWLSVKSLYTVMRATGSLD